MTPDMIEARPLEPGPFAPFGDVLDTRGPPDILINAGVCGRYHDRASLDVSDGRAGISLFDAAPRRMPYTVDLLERHPLGSQAFLPLSDHGFLVVVAEDLGDRPGAIHAFLSQPGQGVNFFRGVWHGVLTPLAAPGRFAVVDRIGPGRNLEEYRLPRPVTVTGGTS